MKFIKLGAAYINMELVTDIWVDDDHVSVFLAVPAMYTPVPFQGTTTATTTRTLQFSGAEAAALIDWLEHKSKAKDISPTGSSKHKDDTANAPAQDELVEDDDQLEEPVRYSD